MGENICFSLAVAKELAHLAVSLLQVNPTAIGRIPPAFFSRASRFPPNKMWDDLRIASTPQQEVDKGGNSSNKLPTRLCAFDQVKQVLRSQSVRASGGAGRKGLDSFSHFGLRTLVEAAEAEMSRPEGVCQRVPEDVSLEAC